MTWNHLVQQVREYGRYDSGREAERVLEAVLATFGGQLVGEERCDLAAALPDRAREILVAQIPHIEPLDAPALVAAIATTLNTTTASARWDTSSVLAVLADHVGTPLTDRLIAQLPAGYALLFGRASLATAA
ncbi:DUF2267 domain-containing protein [Kitasatospora sp. NPDC101801]|uniref:DUF2267 domain-containing protein n=1 Tax=Kitasatospora sp. NPDC101801 TaxID=3364103 RepID=UPI00381266DC